MTRDDFSRVGHLEEGNMMQTRTGLLLATVLTLTVACSEDAALGLDGSRVTIQHVTAHSRPVSLQEVMLRERILTLVPAESRAVYDSLLETGKPLRVYSKPRLDSALRELNRVRENAPRALTRADHAVATQIAMVDSLPLPNSRVIILRRASVEPHDVILVRPDATVHDFYAATTALVRMRKRGGDVPSRSTATAITPTGNRSWNDARDVMAAGVLRELSRSPVVSLAGLGKARSIQILLTPVRKN